MQADNEVVKIITQTYRHPDDLNWPLNKLPAIGRELVSRMTIDGYGSMGDGVSAFRPELLEEVLREDNIDKYMARDGRFYRRVAMPITRLQLQEMESDFGF